MKETNSILSQHLRSNQHVLSSKQVVTGFDGFIDSIQKVVFQSNPDGEPEYFATVKSFGDYIAGKGTGGLSLETEELFKKLGGNAPIMSNALASAGARVHCIGALGYPTPDAVFLDMHSNSTLHSFTEPGITSALEFNDGKIMLAHMTQLNKADWNLIKERIGLENMLQLIGVSDMLCLLNWSETKHAEQIWAGLLNEVLPHIDRRLKVFFDLSDCSKLSSDRIRQALELIRSFQSFCNVTLSLNRNEALLVYKAVSNYSTNDVTEAGKGIFEFLGIYMVVIHTSEGSSAWHIAGCNNAAAFSITHPSISTGAGDNFNAGFCIADLLGLCIQDALITANALAACYMKNGKSPELEELANFLETTTR